MALADLQSIRTKVRRLTRKPSEAMLSTTQIDQYVNNFMLYDMPAQLRLFALKTTFTFYTKPNVDVYPTGIESGNQQDPLYNFKNKYITVHQPFYAAGYNLQFSQSRESFYANYPFLNNIQSIGVEGDNVTSLFTGVIPNTPFLQNNVLFSSKNAQNLSLAMIDVPILDQASGNPTTFGVLIPYDSDPALLGLPLRNIPDYNNAVTNPQFAPYVDNQINYLTGAYRVTFPTPPVQGAQINSQTVPYNASRPQSILYYDEKFVIRPVPDQAYRIDLQAFVRPLELLSSGQVPFLEQWWQYLAYGAAFQFFNEYENTEAIQFHTPEFDKQKREVLRTTLVQYSNQRAPTIYAGQTDNTSSMQGYAGFFGWTNF